MALRAGGGELRSSEVRELLLTDLPPDILEHVLGNTFVRPSHIGSALNSCRALARLDPWHPAYKARWGKAGVQPRASVGKMTYSLRDECERFNWPAVELGFKLGARESYRLERRWYPTPATLITNQEIRRPQRSHSYYQEYNPTVAHKCVLGSAALALHKCATSAASACALMAALKQGLYILSIQENSGCHDKGWAPHKFDWRVLRFVLAGPRGDLVDIRATDVAQQLDYIDKDDRRWRLDATVVEVPDEPLMAEAVREWLTKGADRDRMWGPGPPSPPPGCGEPIRLIDYHVACDIANEMLLEQYIKPPRRQPS
jgi:hypothetical protein